MSGDVSIKECGHRRCRTEVCELMATSITESGRTRGTSRRGVNGNEGSRAYSERQLRNLLMALEAFRKGDISVKLAKERDDIYGQLADSYNQAVAMVGGMAVEVSRVARAGGEEGKLTARAKVEGVSGSGKHIVDTLNYLLDSIATPVTEIGRVVTAIRSEERRVGKECS